MIIDAISDLHGHYPKLDGGDLLIVAGDLTKNDSPNQVNQFIVWACRQNYDRVLIIAGNHDNVLEHDHQSGHTYECLPLPNTKSYVSFLCDAGTEFKGLKIWGSSWTKTFQGMNPKCKAFTVDTEEELADKFSSIPHDVDILITHSPPHDLLDQTVWKEHVGSLYLRGALEYCFRPQLWVFGHIHESYGKTEYKTCSTGKPCILVNASHVNEIYQPVNKPFRIEL